MIAMVLFDKTTNRIVLFDENGNVSKDGNGKLVYQFLRDVRQENNKYRVTDIYGISDTVISPTQIVENEIAELEITKEELAAGYLAAFYNGRTSQKSLRYF